MNTAELIFWIVVGVAIGALLVIIANQIITNLLRTTVTVNP